MLRLPSVLHSLSPPSLSNHLSTFRRDVLAYFVDHVLKQPYAVFIESSLTHEAKLSLIPAPPNNEDLSSRLNNISTILEFLYSQIFPHLPPNDATHLTRSLSKPITTSVLNNLLIPALPSSFGLLPSYLNLLKCAVVFEEKDVSKLLESDRNVGSIKAWSDGVSGHYERRRRIEILELARKEIMEAEDPNDTFEAFSEGGPETSLPSVIPFQADAEEVQEDAWGLDEPMTADVTNSSADGWGLDEPATSAAEDESADGWGFDDELEPEPEVEVQTPTDSKATDQKDTPTDAEPDPTDAWGWNEEEDLPANDIPETSAWDDPWSDPPDTEPIPEPEPTPHSPPANIMSPKAATRLEKLASKNKRHANGNSSVSNSPAPSPLAPPLEPHVTFTPASPHQPEHNPPPKSSRLNPGKRPAAVMTTIAPKEMYRVPKRSKRIIKMVEIVIDESKLFFASNLFGSPSNDQISAPGTILLQAASSILDLYQAVYPTKFAEELKSPERAMLFSNSCVYMTGAVQRVEDTIYGQPTLKEKLTECRHRLQVLGESWYEDTMVRPFTNFIYHVTDWLV
jgi:centromere/kinetochore protein ZW10